MRIGYHASHEQHPPRDLLRYVQLAERAGFDEAMTSDHIMPFTERQGHSGFAWSWLGAALEATSMRFGVVTTPGYRYHPAILAQAAATLGQMYPGRFWFALGSGELLNEHVVGMRWPAKDERNQRLEQSAQGIRRLLAGETVTEDGLIRFEEARLYVQPSERVPIIAAAITADTARWAASWADGLITVAGPPEAMAEQIAAFREGGGAGKPVYLQAQLSFAATDEEATCAAWEQWRVSALSSDVLADLRMPSQFEGATETARPEDIVSKVRSSADPAQHIEWLREYREVGFDAVFLHNVQRDEETFIRRFGEEVLPELRS